MPERPDERDLTAIESALREMRPKPAAMDRDVLMYRAGRASAHSWLWPAATLVSTTAALALSVALCIQPSPPIVYVAVPSTQNDAVSASLPSPSSEDEAKPGAWARYIHLQEQVTLHGLDGLPPPPSGTQEPSPDVELLLNSLR
jgi:hypothetical protein